MAESEQSRQQSSWHTQNTVWLAVGSLVLLYGLLSLLIGKSYLPGLWKQKWVVTGADGFALALAYIVLGAFLIFEHRWFQRYVVGIGLALLSAGYGAYALMAGRSYLPGLRGGTTAVTGAHGRGVAMVYLFGGMYLLCRLFLEKHVHSESSRTQFYLFENALLLVLVGSLVYVLLNVGTAGGL